MSDIDDFVQRLEQRGLVLAPRSLLAQRGAGGGGARFTGIRAGRYVGVSSLTVNGKGQIVSVETEGLGSECSNTLVVNSLSDLPDPIAGRIQLPDDTRVRPCGVVDLGTNVLVCGEGTVIRGNTQSLDGFVTNSASALINASGGQSGVFRTLHLVNNGGPIFDYQGDGVVNFHLDQVVMSAGSIGRIEDVAVIEIHELELSGMTDGLVVDGANMGMEIAQCLSANNVDGFTFLTLPATASFSGGILLTENVVVSNATQTALDFAPGATLAGALIISNILVGAGTALSGVTKAELFYDFRDNIGILDSQSIGNMAFTGNLGGQDTVISVQGAFVPIGNGNAAHPLFVANPSNERFDLEGATTAAQLLRYRNFRDNQLSVRAAVAVQPDAVVGALGFAIRILQNGVPVPNTEIEGQTGGVLLAAGSTYTEGVVTAATDDTFTLEIANTTGTEDLTVSAALLSVGIAG